MKKTVFSILITIILTLNSFATIRNIQVSNFVFTPASVNAFIGDTIKWVWVSGSHTTTSTNIPLTALTWDSPITSTNTTYTYVITKSGTYNYKCTPHEAMGMVGVINVQSVSIVNNESVALTYTLKQNYPNPFNPTTQIIYSIPKFSNVSVKVYDILGQEIATLVNEKKSKGVYTVRWETENASTGLYMYRLVTGDYELTRKMILTK